MLNVIYVFIGGGVGSVLRYLISQASSNLNGSLKFPIGTLLCNILGCFFIGLFNALATKFGWDPSLKLMLTVGLCGGFTTFSTFSNESLAMLNAGNYTTYAIYLLLSIILGIAAVYLGVVVKS